METRPDSIEYLQLWIMPLKKDKSLEKLPKIQVCCSRCLCQKKERKLVAELLSMYDQLEKLYDVTH